MKTTGPACMITLAFVCLLCLGQATASNSAIVVVPTSINFNNEVVNQTSGQRTVTITNISTAAETVNGDSITPTKFALSGPSLPITLQPGNSATFTVTFSPGTTTGASSGQLTFHTTDATNNTTTKVSLKGNGVSTNPAAIAISPTSIAFGDQSAGVVTCGNAVVVSNGGSTTATINSATITGPFAVTAFTPNSVTAGGTSSANVSYSPQPPGQSDSGTLTVTMSNGAIRTVAISGTGVATNWNVDPSGKIPLIDMGDGSAPSPRKYVGLEGGLFDHGCNNPPVDHDAAGRAFAALVQPLSTTGAPSPTGKVVVLSIGMSNAIKEWCGLGGAIGSCETGVNNSFMAQAASSPLVNNTNLVILDGAASMQQATDWDSSTDPDYDSVKNNVLTPNYTEQQVQVLWLKEVNITPTGTPSLPATNADAYVLEKTLGNIVRAAKSRYPNLRIVFLTSRIFGDFATPDVTREPYAYETGYAVKFLIKAQIDQMRNGGVIVDQNAPDLDYLTSTTGGAPGAPWIVWERLNGTTALTGSTYIWAYSDKITQTAYANSDGVMWPRNYFESDGQHPNTTLGIPQVGTLLINYFLNSCYTKPWFLRSPSSCQ